MTSSIVFSDVEGKGRYNSITSTPSILTSYDKQTKLSDYQSSKMNDPFSPDIPMRKPTSPYPDIEDDREPIDEPILPQDPGDVPEELRIFRVARKHFGEVVTVTYRFRGFTAHTTGTLAASLRKLHVMHESRRIIIRLENVISIVFKDGSWIKRK